MTQIDQVAEHDDAPAAPLTVVVGNAISPAEAAYLSSRDDRLHVITDFELLPPQRYPGDFAGDPAFRRSPTQQSEFEALLSRADILFGIPDLDPRTLRRTLDANPELRWVHTMAAGGGNAIRAADLTSAQLARTIFTTSAGVHARPLAEFALLGLLAGAKSLPRLLAQQRQHLWSERWHTGQLSSMTVLLVGFGGIGREIATELRSRGTRVIATSRRPISSDDVDEFVAPSEIAVVAPRVDAAVVSLPGTDNTEGLLGRQFFDAIRPGATLVNVGRGSVVDHGAMTAALRSGRLGFAALDVTAVEPLPATDPLWDLPNVLISPHTAAISVHEARLITELFARNATAFLDGTPLENVVNTVLFY